MSIQNQNYILDSQSLNYDESYSFSENDQTDKKDLTIKNKALAVILALGVVLAVAGVVLSAGAFAGILASGFAFAGTAMFGTGLLTTVGSILFRKSINENNLSIEDNFDDSLFEKSDIESESSDKQTEINNSGSYSTTENVNLEELTAETSNVNQDIDSSS